ncbi:albumin-1-like [Trifolium pratense]|uniref:albumin-1-like n=1 Tax=Trifolium pratense TaxID=57577 RepID=UPI001E6929DC|nr:albumin-1-like [Trifolium pratense]
MRLTKLSLRLWALFGGTCIYPTGSESESITKMVEEHPNLCESHDECLEKKSGSFCARYPNPDIPYGWCFDSKTEAERIFEIGSNYAIKGFFNSHSNSKAKEFLKMHLLL